MKIKNIAGVALAAILALVCSHSWASLTATADRTVIDSNETLQLLVRLDSQALMGEPDFTVIESNFEILSTSRQQQYSRVNGQTQSFTDWNLLLAPKRTGQLLVPSIKYKKDISNAIEITVRKASVCCTPKMEALLRNKARSLSAFHSVMCLLRAKVKLVFKPKTSSLL